MVKKKVAKQKTRKKTAKKKTIRKTTKKAAGKKKVTLRKVVKKKTATKNKGGRPSVYKTEYAEQSKKLCMLLRAEDTNLADFFGVKVLTIHNWKKQHPEFLYAIREGKEIADMNVVRSLYDRAVGYYHDDIHFSTHKGVVKQTKHKTFIPPDTKAIIFWLKNRQKEVWRDVFGHTDGEGGSFSIIIHERPESER